MPSSPWERPAVPWKWDLDPMEQRILGCKEPRAWPEKCGVDLLARVGSLEHLWDLTKMLGSHCFGLKLETKEQFPVSRHIFKSSWPEGKNCSTRRNKFCTKLCRTLCYSLRSSPKIAQTQKWDLLTLPGGETREEWPLPCWQIKKYLQTALNWELD